MKKNKIGPKRKEGHVVLEQQGEYMRT